MGAGVRLEGGGDDSGEEPKGEGLPGSGWTRPYPRRCSSCRCGSVSPVPLSRRRKPRTFCNSASRLSTTGLPDATAPKKAAGRGGSAGSAMLRPGRGGDAAASPGNGGGEMAARRGPAEAALAAGAARWPSVSRLCVTAPRCQRCHTAAGLQELFEMDVWLGTLL